MNVCKERVENIVNMEILYTESLIRTARLDLERADQKVNDLEAQLERLESMQEQIKKLNNGNNNDLINGKE